jgi:hypothetical protein
MRREAKGTLQDVALVGRCLYQLFLGTSAAKFLNSAVAQTGGSSYANHTWPYVAATLRKAVISAHIECIATEG